MIPFACPSADIDQVTAFLTLPLPLPPAPFVCFACSETSFHIFIVMASRRLESDRFLTKDFTPEVLCAHVTSPTKSFRRRRRRRVHACVCRTIGVGRPPQNVPRIAGRRSPATHSPDRPITPASSQQGKTCDDRVRSFVLSLSPKVTPRKRSVANGTTRRPTCSCHVVASATGVLPGGLRPRVQHGGD